MLKYEIETKNVETPYGDLIVRSSLKKTKQLIFLLGGAINRDVKLPPVYQRATWLKDLPVSAVALADETLMLDDDIELGWYLGDEKEEFLNKLKAGIYRIARDEGVEFSDIMFFGSSGGGFASALLSSYFRGSKCLIVNTQTDISRYIKKVYDKFMDVTGAKDGVYKHSLMELFEVKRYVPNIQYYQNVRDTFHYNNHYIPFLSWYSDSKPALHETGLVTFKEYSLPGGHSGLHEKHETESFIMEYFRDSELSNNGEKYTLSAKKNRFVTLETFTRKIVLDVVSDSLDSKLALYYDGYIDERNKSHLIYLGWRESKTLGLFKYVSKKEESYTLNLDMSDFSNLPFLKLTNWSGGDLMLGIHYE